MEQDKTAKNIGRRDFIKSSAGIAAGMAACAGGCASIKKPCPVSAPVFTLKRKRSSLADLTRGKQPNILFILTDQERCAANLPSTLKRPNFDRLRGTAVNFTNAFCVYPLCSPSRSAIFTGMYPHQTGITQNMIFPVGEKELDPKKPHIGSVFASAGYRVGYKGKWDLSKGPTYYLANLSDRGRAGKYGYEGHCGKVPDQEYAYASDDTVVADACEWIRSQSKDRPWFLCCSIINPHDICHPQLKPDDSIRPDVLLPASLHDDLLGKPADQRRLRDSKVAHVNRVFNPKAKPTSEYDEKDWKLFLSFYYDLIELTDKYIGALYKTLEDMDMLDDTIIVYNSDHGELGGAHGFSGKNEGYEEDIHIPLYISHPGLQRMDVDALVSNICIAPTLAGLAGADWPRPVPGRDLSGHITGEGGPVFDAVFSETQTHVDLGVYRMIYATRMVRTTRWKYSYSFYDVQDGQLYDLENDPIEMNNLFHDADYSGIRRELEERMKAWQRDTKDSFRLKA